MRGPAHTNVRWSTNPTHMIANAIGMTSGGTNQEAAFSRYCSAVNIWHSLPMTGDQDWSLGHRRVGSTYSADDQVYMGSFASIYEARAWVYLHSF
jgi:hypothetical protein